MLQVEEVEEVKVVTKADDAEQKRNQNFEWIAGRTWENANWLN
jgi:hypothetical protein